MSRAKGPGWIPAMEAIRGFSFWVEVKARVALIPLWKQRKQVDASPPPDDIVGYVLVDDDDATTAIVAFKWHLNSHGYAYRMAHKRAVLMHRQFLGLEYGQRLQGDHINRNRLDNTRRNLRVVSAEMNAQNTSSHKGSASRHRGVSKDGERNCWRAGINLNGRYIRKRFASEALAAEFAANLRRQYMPGAV